MLFTDEQSTSTLGRYPGARSLALSLCFHIVAVTIFWLASLARPAPQLGLPKRTILLAENLRAPRMPSKATPPRRAPSKAAQPGPTLAARHILAPRPLAIPRAAPPPDPAPATLAPAPVIAVQPPPSIAPTDALPRLAPAPIRTGDFAELNSTPRKPSEPAAHPGAPGSFDAATPAPAVNARPPAPASTPAFDSAATAKNPARVPGKLVSQSSFGDATVAQPGRHLSGASTSVQDTAPVEIQFKPLPEYTEEARRRRMEGEVLLEMLFTASGEARVLRIVHGLGYGLDEAAEAAARQVRFVPARRAGSPVDSRAVIHIQFQLAY